MEIRTHEGAQDKAVDLQVGQIGPEQLKVLTQALQRYKAGKATTERRIIASENWWKLRNSSEESAVSATLGKGGYKSSSGWLHNVIASKHADAMDAYPEPNILPREKNDREEAQMLSAIIPCVLEQNDYEQTYSEVQWQKLKSGTGVYKAIWDKTKLNGLGDIAIAKANPLNLYWEPGITDIQKSRLLFHTELVDKDLLEESHPELKDKIRGDTSISARFLYDDAVPLDGKATVIECYYHKAVEGRQVLHYVQYVGDSVLFATENDPKMSETGLYEHGMYPYVFDPLFPIEGSPCGYGFVDLCKNPQTTIDLLNTSFIKSAMVGATPRYFKRADGGVNEEEFLDLTKAIVNVTGNLGEDSLRQIPHTPMNGIYVSFLDRVIQELRETSGNTETSTGNISSGVTAASAIAALQEASGKGSRDSNLSAYRAYRELVNLCIEMIRQFYELPRKFRITGQYGEEQYVSYDNSGIQAQELGGDFGTEQGFRLPVFDIKISAQKKNTYSKVTQNELAIQFFHMGFFNPQLTDQALMTLDLMEFDGKEDVMQKVAQNGTMYQKMAMYMQLSLELAKRAAPDMVQQLSQDVMQSLGGQAQGGAMPELKEGKEPTFMQNARARTAENAQPAGGRVTRSAGND